MKKRCFFTSSVPPWVGQHTEQQDQWQTYCTSYPHSDWPVEVQRSHVKVSITPVMKIVANSVYSIVELLLRWKCHHYGSWDLGYQSTRNINHQTEQMKILRPKLRSRMATSTYPHSTEAFWAVTYKELLDDIPVVVAEHFKSFQYYHFEIKPTEVFRTQNSGEFRVTLEVQLRIALVPNSNNKKMINYVLRRMKGQDKHSCVFKSSHVISDQSATSAPTHAHTWTLQHLPAGGPAKMQRRHTLEPHSVCTLSRQHAWHTARDNRRRCTKMPST